MSSIGGLAVSPTAAVYCATKFAVRAISDGLRQESDKLSIKPEAIGRAILHVMEQPEDVDTNEIVIRPTATR